MRALVRILAILHSGIKSSLSGTYTWLTYCCFTARNRQCRSGSIRRWSAHKGKLTVTPRVKMRMHSSDHALLVHQMKYAQNKVKNNPCSSTNMLPQKRRPPKKRLLQYMQSHNAFWFAMRSVLHCTIAVMLIPVGVHGVYQPYVNSGSNGLTAYSSYASLPAGPLDHFRAEGRACSPTAPPMLLLALTTT